jgi:hypothetical protein
MSQNEQLIQVQQILLQELMRLIRRRRQLPGPWSPENVSFDPSPCLVFKN